MHRLLIQNELHVRRAFSKKIESGGPATLDPARATTSSRRSAGKAEACGGVGERVSPAACFACKVCLTVNYMFSYMFAY